MFHLHVVQSWRLQEERDKNDPKVVSLWMYLRWHSYAQSRTRNHLLWTWKLQKENYGDELLKLKLSFICTFNSPVTIQIYKINEEEAE